MSGKSWKFERNTATNRTGSGVHKNKRNHLRSVAEKEDCDEELEGYLKYGEEEEKEVEELVESLIDKILEEEESE